MTLVSGFTGKKFTFFFSTEMTKHKKTLQRSEKKSQQRKFESKIENKSRNFIAKKLTFNATQQSQREVVTLINSRSIDECKKKSEILRKYLQRSSCTELLITNAA